MVATISTQMTDIDARLQSTIDTLLKACHEISERLRQGTTDSDPKGQHTNAPSTNRSGDWQKPLDVLSNDILKKHLSSCTEIFAFSSEEEAEAVLLHPEGDYLVSFDPLDGSSNSDVNMCVGTIFSILKKQGEGDAIEVNHQFLQPGHKQVAAGFVVYGPATTAIIGTHSNTPSANSHLLELRLVNAQWHIINADFRCPQQTEEYAINTANSLLWHAPIRTYINQCLQGEQGIRGKTYNMRWLGSMVADMYRIFKRGGVFIYPGDARNPNGKIRLLYEANPIALLMQLAGGRSTDGKGSILDILPTEIHQKIPVMIGSEEEIKHIERLHQ